MNKLLALSLSALALSGCATALTMDKAKDVKAFTEQDQIRYIAQIRDGRVPDLLLLGDKYSYRIMGKDGSLTALTTLATTLDARHIRAKPVQFRLSSYGQGIADGGVQFVFDYTKDTPLNSSETALLGKYCQKLGNTYTNCTLSFHAQQGAKQAPTAQMTALKGNYPVVITGFKKSAGIGTALVPFAVALDAITLPVQGLMMMGCEKDCFK